MIGQHYFGWWLGTVNQRTITWPNADPDLWCRIALLFKRTAFLYTPVLKNISKIAKFMGPTWGPPGSCRPQVDPMLVPWTLPCLAQDSLVVPLWRPLDRLRNPLFRPGEKSPMITDQHTAGSSVSQLRQLTKLSPWLTLSTKDITTSFWHYDKWFCFLSNQIIGLY